jgi:hypothetical protein
MYSGFIRRRRRKKQNNKKTLSKKTRIQRWASVRKETLEALVEKKKKRLHPPDTVSVSVGHLNS